MLHPPPRPPTNTCRPLSASPLQPLAFGIHRPKGFYRTPRRFVHPHVCSSILFISGLCRAVFPTTEPAPTRLKVPVVYSSCCPSSLLLLVLLSAKISGIECLLHPPHHPRAGTGFSFSLGFQAAASPPSPRSSRTSDGEDTVVASEACVACGFIATLFGGRNTIRRAVNGVRHI